MVDPIRLEIFKHLFAAVPDEMGALLRKSSYSPNIKERRDFSCAIFDCEGNLIAQAAHIPVHLGAMPLSVQAVLAKFPAGKLGPGDTIILNDPYQGGSHLPDITLVSPIYLPEEIDSAAGPISESRGLLLGYAANRAHHADVGGMTPGSMPIAQELVQEGLILPPVRLIESGEINLDIWDLILANVRTAQERAGDLRAQIAANQRGVSRMIGLFRQYGYDQVNHYMAELLRYTETLTRNLLREIPDGRYEFTDYLDDDGVSYEPIPVKVAITIREDSAEIDFSGSAPQQRGSVNAVYAITLSAVYYVFRGLLGLDVPNNSGALVPLKVVAPEGSVVNARYPAPVSGGNVETSQRITDVLLGAMAQAVPDKVPAASQGTMNNITIGGMDFRQTQPRPYTYYETICGGMGASSLGDGPSARHSHMTNTLNTPVEALEYAFPFRVERYEILQGTGGQGEFRGGDGVRRDLRILYPAQLNLICERRARPPYGLSGGRPGTCGCDRIYRDGKEIRIPSKGSFQVQAGDIISISTPGGGGFGEPEDLDRQLRSVETAVAFVL